MTDDLYEYHFPADPTLELKVGDEVDTPDYAKFGGKLTAQSFATPDDFSYSPPFKVADLYDPCQEGDLLLENREGQTGWVHRSYVTKVVPTDEAEEILALGYELDGEQSDPVHSPQHYRGKGGLEAIDVIEAFDLNYRLGNAQKYLLRAGKKGDAVTDLRKAIWYLEREIGRR